MKPIGLKSIEARKRWAFCRHCSRPGDEIKACQRARQTRETTLLIDEQLDGRNPNNPCDWGNCKACDEA